MCNLSWQRLRWWVQGCWEMRAAAQRSDVAFRYCRASELFSASAQCAMQTQQTRDTQTQRRRTLVAFVALYVSSLRFCFFFLFSLPLRCARRTSGGGRWAAEQEAPRKEDQRTGSARPGMAAEKRQTKGLGQRNISGGEPARPETQRVWGEASVRARRSGQEAFMLMVGECFSKAGCLPTSWSREKFGDTGQQVSTVVGSGKSA